MKTALFGCGGWGQTILDVSRDVQGLDIDVVYDPRSWLSERFRDPSGPKFVSDENLLRRINIDTAIIATPAEHRLRAMRLAKSIGAKRFRVEKPIATTISDIDRMLNSKMDIVVGHTPLYATGAKYMKGFCHGAGDVSLSFVRNSPDRARHDTTELLDLAVHDIAYIIDWFPDVPISILGVDDGRLSLGIGDSSAKLSFGWNMGAKQRTSTAYSMVNDSMADHDEITQMIAYQSKDTLKTIEHLPCNPLKMELEDWVSGGGMKIEKFAFATRIAIVAQKMLDRRHLHR